MKYKPHAVYLMKNMWSDANYKIGFSNNPSRRGVEVEDQYGVEPKLSAPVGFLLSLMPEQQNAFGIDATRTIGLKTTQGRNGSH